MASQRAHFWIECWGDLFWPGVHKIAFDHVEAQPVNLKWKTSHDNLQTYIQLLTTCVCNLFPWKYPRGQNRTHLPCWYTRLQLWTTIFSSCVINKRMDWKTNTIISSLCLSGHQNNGSIIGGNWLEQWNGRWVPTEFDWFNYRSQNLLRNFKQVTMGNEQWDFWGSS